MKHTVVVLLLLALLMPVQGSEVETATSYAYVIEVEDPQGDHTGPNALAGGPVPGTFNNENDLLLVEITDDAQAFIIRITTAQCDFDVPVGFALVIFEITGPNGEDWDVSVAYDDGCANPRGIEVDSVLGDDDVPMPGLRFGADPANDQLYIFSDYADNGMENGQSVNFDRVHTGRQFAGRYTFGMDEVVVPPFTVGSGKELNIAVPEVEAPTGPTVEFLELAGDSLSHRQANATITYHYNWTAPEEATNGTFLLDVNGTAGHVNVTIHDAAGDLLLTATPASGNMSQGFEEAPGPWNLTVEYGDFTGQLDLQWIAPDAPEAVAPSEPNQPEPVEDDEAPGGASEENETATPTGDNEESPGAPFVMIAGLLGLVAWLRRR